MSHSELAVITPENLRTLGFTVDQAMEQKGSALYVLNNSGNVRGMTEGLIIINVPITDSNQRTLRVPATWVPVNIGMQIPKNYVFNTPEFLDAIMRQALIIVPNEVAERLFKEDDSAAVERDRVHADLMGTGRFGTDDRRAPDNPAQEIEDAIDPELNVQMAEAVHREDITEAELFGVLRRLDMNKRLKTKDYDYVAKISQFEKIRTWANGRLAQEARTARRN